MKPLYVLVAGAVVAVGALVLFMAEPGGGRGRTGAREVAPEPPPPEPARVPAGGAVTVAVVLPDGAAAAGAALELLGRAARSLGAGADGTARIEGLPPGSYSLLARKERFAGALAFELDGDRDLGTLRLSAALSVRGRVLSVEDGPIPGAIVEASHAVAEAVTRSLDADAVAARAAAGPDGAYELLLPGAGRYRLRASAEGFAPAIEADRPFEADARGIDFRLLPGSVVEGRVVDAGGRGVPGARVVATPAAPSRAKATATSGDDGRFAVAVAAGTDVSLRVSAAGFAPHTERRLRPPVRDLLVALEAGLSLRLRAVDEATGQPLAGIAVSLRLADAARDGATGADGEARFDALPGEGGRAWRAQVVLAGGGYAPKIEDAARVEASAGGIDLGDVALRRGGTVRGRVLEKGTLAPVPGARVTWFATADFQTMAMDATRAVSGGDGGYELTGVPLDAKAILAVRDGYVGDADFRELVRKQESVFPDGRDLVEVDVVLSPARAVTGFVLAPDGSPAAGARVSTPAGGFRALLGPPLSDAIAGEDGAFALQGLAEGAEAVVRAEHRAFAGSEPVRATAGGEPVTLRLLDPLAVRGTVVDAERRALADVRVSIGRREDAAEGVTDSLGRFLVRNARGGDVEVTFDHPEYRVRQVPLAAAAGEHDMGEVVLDRGPGIEGTVEDGTGAPQDGVRVFATWMAEPGAAVARDPAAGRTWAQAHTRAGRFALHGLREGRYRLQVQREGFFGGRPVVPTGTRDVRMVLKAAAEVRGVVLGGGGPVGGAFVRAFLGEGPVGGGWLAGARTDAQGAFTLAGLPPDEPFDLGVAHPDYRELRVRGVRATGERKELVLDAGAGFAGVVVEPDGTPVPNATVHVLSGGRSVKFERADAAGRFEVSGLGEGPFSAEVSWTPIGHVKTGPVAVRPGDRDVRFVVERGERISGEVRWKDPSDARAVRIEALGPDGDALAQAWVWPQNRKFEITGLPKGTYALRVSRAVEGGFRAVAHVPGVESGAADIRIEVPN